MGFFENLKKYAENRVDFHVSPRRLSAKSELTGLEKSTEPYLFVDKKNIVVGIGEHDVPQSHWIRMDAFGDTVHEQVFQSLVKFLLAEVIGKKHIFRPDVHVFGIGDIPSILFHKPDPLQCEKNKYRFLEQSLIDAGAKKVILNP